MAATAETPDSESKKSSKVPLIIGLVLAIAGGGGAFYALYSGMFYSGAPAESKEAEAVAVEPLPEIVFVPLEQIVVSLGPSAKNRHLRFRAQLEVDPAYEQDVTHLTPRIIDVLNSYLRALDASDIEASGALIKLRAQMLRRIQIVVGQGRVNDLLVMEFVLN